MGVVSFCPCHRIVYNNHFIVVYSDMKKIILFIVFFVYLIQCGWAQVDVENKLFIKELIKVPDDEWPTQVVFDTVHVCYAGTLRWIIMANPNLGGQNPPNHIARIMTVHCFCVMDKLRTEYKFTPYTDMLKGDDPLMPKFLPELFMKKALECIKEHNTLFGLVVLDPNLDVDNLINKAQNYLDLKKDNETKNDTQIEVKPPDNNSGKSDSIPEQPKELPTEDAPLLNF